MLNKRYYFVLNIILPILVGVMIYVGNKHGLITNYISSYIPDGLWAYSFTSTILIIWNRQINIFWFVILGICFVIFEIMQSSNIIKGTGDIVDVIVYFLFGLSSVIINNMLKNKKYEKI